MNIPIRRFPKSVPAAKSILILLKDAEARGLKDITRLYRDSLIRMCRERLEELSKRND